MAGRVDGQVHGIERVVAHDLEAVCLGPREDPLLVVIDEVERPLASTVAPEIVEEAALQDAHCLRQGRRRRAHLQARRFAGAAGTSSTANSRSRTSRWCVTSWMAFSYGNLLTRRNVPQPFSSQMP